MSSDIEEDLELRDAEGDLEQYGYAARHPRIFYPLTEEECAGAGLPLHPDVLLDMGYAGYGEDWDGRQRRHWSINYESVIELFAARIYLALKEGRLAASGKLLGDQDRERAMDILKAQDQRLWDLPTVEIPSHFWSLSGIDWSSNAALNLHEHYCWIRCQTDAVLKTFPWENREPVAGMERVGENFILNDSSEKPQQSGRLRGRPSFPWDAFHLEVTDLLLRGAMPTKKGVSDPAFPGLVRANPQRAPGSNVDRRQTETLLRPLRQTGGQKLTRRVFCPNRSNNCLLRPLVGWSRIRGRSPPAPGASR